MIFWIIYILLSLVISILLSSLFSKKIYKLLILSLSFSLITAVWLRAPGENSLSPIITILLLENTILDNNGYIRIFRPLSVFVSFSIISILLWRKIFKN